MKIIRPIPVLAAFAFALTAPSMWMPGSWAAEAGSPATEFSITLRGTFTPAASAADAEGATLQGYPAVAVDTSGDRAAEARDHRVETALPARLDLVKGEKYRLKIVNASNSVHYFWAPDLEGVAAQPSRVTVDKGNIGNRTVETSGQEHATAEIEIHPGGTAVWEFVPQVAGKFKWGCAMPSHDAAGMNGEIAVAPAIAG